MNSVRLAARHLGAGRGYLKARHLWELGITNKARIELAKRRYLPRIEQAAPLSMPSPVLEVHMLLHHARVYEALWALYSLALQSSWQFTPVIHEDGSLTPSDKELLQRIFPQTRIVDRKTADEVVLEHLKREGLKRSSRLREAFVMSLKLFDVQFFSETDQIILLDSDVLFFQPTTELDLPGDDSQAYPLYSLDNQNNYSLDTEQMSTLLGRPCIERFNPGVVRTNPGVLNFARIESYLEHPSFWKPDGTPDYFSELTLWAMELTTAGAKPLSGGYVGYSPAVDTQQVPSIHYYGGEPYAGPAYYTRALPSLAKDIFGLSRRHSVETGSSHQAV